MRTPPFKRQTRNIGAMTRAIAWTVRAGPVGLLMLVLAGFLALSDGPAVRRGELVVTHVADLPDLAELRIGGVPAALGYLHREVSILDLPLWVYDEQGLVLYRKDGPRRSYTPLDDNHRAALDRASDGQWTAPEALGPLGRWSGLLLVILLLAAGAAPGRVTRPNPARQRIAALGAGPGPGRRCRNWGAVRQRLALHLRST